MQALIKTHRTDSAGEIVLTVPAEDVDALVQAISGMLALAGHTVREVNAEGEELFSVAEVFPERAPGMVLRGLRQKEDMTQDELAERVGMKQHHVSEMESGKRPISLGSAKKYAEIFQVPYQMLL